MLGMLGMVFNQLLFLSGLSLTTATNAGMVSPAISVFSTAISAMLCLEKLSLWKVGGISVTVAGALIILEVTDLCACVRHSRLWYCAHTTTRHDMQVENFELFGSNDILLGNLLAIMSTVCFSFFIVLQKPLTARITPTVLNFFVFAVGLVVIVPMTLIGFWDEVVDVAYNAPLNAYGSTLYSAFIAGVIGTLCPLYHCARNLSCRLTDCMRSTGYSLNTWAIHQIAASNVALFYCLQALMIALFAWVLLDEQLTIRVAIGGVLIMVGLFTVTWSLDRQRKKDAAFLEAMNQLDDDEKAREEAKLGVMAKDVMKLSHDDWASPMIPPSPGSGEQQQQQQEKRKEAEYGTFV
jgi:drug/metabolite transporter (DMT)-like permease